MVKPLSFKGDKKAKKRKHRDGDEAAPDSRPAKAAATDGDDGDDATEDDHWVTAEAAADLTGPVVIVLPSDPPTCIACDPTGHIFASALENMVESDPSTAEPHDVRQVWIANQIAGTDTVSLKGHHGKYLTADKYGLLTATREAISAEEQFTCIPSADTPGTFSVQTQRELFLSAGEGAKGPEVRADAEAISFATTVRIRMQARFKPVLKTGKETRAREKISRRELEAAVGRTLEDDEVKRLKKARREGNYHEALLDVKVKGKHDKFA